MKSSTARPAAETTITTITKETATIAEKPGMPEFWGYLESLKPEDWSNHICYIYRTEPRATFQDTSGGSGISALDKIVGTFEIRPGVSIPFNNREEVELGIRERWGGRTFRLLLKRGSERVTETRVTNEYPPKYPPSGAMNPGTQTSPVISPASDASSTADVSKLAINTLAGQDSRATDVAIRALTGAADVVTRLAEGNRNGAADPLKELAIRMLEKSMVDKDPIEEMTKMVTLINLMKDPHTAIPAGTPAPGSPTERLLNAAIERFLSPAAAAGPVATASAELVRALPQVATYIVEGIREWRVGTEAQRDTAAMMNGVPPARPAAQQAPQPPPRTLPQVPPPQPPPGGTMLTIEFIEGKIIEIFNEGAPAEDAADDTLTFIDRMSPELITQLTSLGESGLLNLFQTRPTLRPATNNMPRLVEFIKAFLRLAGNQQPGAPPPAIIPPTGTAKA